MLNGDWLALARDLVHRAIEGAGTILSEAESFRLWILAHFGDNGFYATCVVGLMLGLFLTIQLIKMFLAVLKYLVIPGVGLAILGSLVLPFSFSFLLPFTLSACTLILLFKG